MRRLIVLAAGILFVSLSAFAQESQSAFALFISNPAYANSFGRGRTLTGGVGASYDYSFTPQFSAALSIAAEEHHIRVVELIPNAPVTIFENVRSYPVDAVARYHFLPGNKMWRPYLGAGLRYVAVPAGLSDLGGNEGSLGVNEVESTFIPVKASSFSDRLSAEINAGLVYQLRPSLGIMLDGKWLLRGSSSESSYDPQFKASLGLLWRL